MTTTPMIHDGFAELDTLTTVPVTKVLGSQLRAGMVLVDELDCRSFGVDHRIRSQVSGAVQFLGADLDNGGWHTMTIGSNTPVRVEARS